MCKAKDYSENILSIYNKINEDFQSLNKELSQIDLYIQDILHKIENIKFNACEGYKFAKMIHEARIKRRTIKNELEPLFLLKQFTNKNLQSLKNAQKTIVKKDNLLTNLTENKIYNPRIVDKQTVETTSKNKSNFTPIPVPSAPKKETTTITTTLGTAIHNKTKERLQIISEIDKEHCVVKRDNGGLQVICSKNLSNLECLQSM